VRVQDFVGWLVPAYVIVGSAAALVGALRAERYSQMWLPVAGLIFGAFLAVQLLQRREEWLRRGEISEPARYDRQG
jgi:hypothetical protein